MKSILLAFAMFSRLPVPQVEFRAENMSRIMVALPLVGLIPGLAVLGWENLCVWLGFGPLLRGAGFALLPLALCGAIHMDGFCDTMDALASHGDPETKQRILRDPHIGSFAALAIGAYLLLFAALAAELPRSAGIHGSGTMVCFALVFVLSRAVGAIATLAFPATPSSHLARHFQGAAKGSLRELGGILACLGLAMLWLGGWAGGLAFALPLLWLWRWQGIAARQFGGMSGDLAGYLIQICELLSLAALVITSMLLERV